MGHLAPSVAVWEAFLELRPGSSAHFVCADRGDDAAFLRNTGCAFTSLDAPHISLGLPWKFFAAVRTSKEILRKIQPDIIFSTGGYVSIPVCFAARGCVPIVLHESDAVSGRANAIVRGWADRVCLGFPQRKIRKPDREVFTGNPVRESLTRGSRDEGLRITGFSGARPILLILGGSKGARDINAIVAKLLPRILEHVDLIHITGRGKGGAKGDAQGSHYFSVEFANAELPHFYACADRAVSRAGASAIAELGENGIPTILVPLRGVAHDHQEKNARATAAQSPLFTVVEQEDLEGVLVAKTPTPSKASRAFKASTSSGSPKTNAARHIAEILVETLEKGRRDA